MSDSIPEAELADLFRKLGANEPESWASSQFNEGTPQLHRFLFLRQAWQSVVDEDDENWIDAYVERSRGYPNEPFAGIGLGLKACLDAGADRRMLTDIVRGMQVELLFSLCYLLGDPAIEEPEARDLGWALFAIDDDGQPMAEVGGLHESVLETDPTGREMRPR